jgi:putative flippase GtrA
MKRWVAFYSVGALGTAVQMAVLWILSSGFGIDYLLATGLGVETAVLHNFLWHQHWTWADRSYSSSGLRRLVLFHLTNGALPLAGNIILMQLFVEDLNFNYLKANALAIAFCSVFTFFAGDRLVFRQYIHEAENEYKN